MLNQSGCVFSVLCWYKTKAKSYFTEHGKHCNLMSNMSYVSRSTYKTTAELLLLEEVFKWEQSSQVQEFHILQVNFEGGLCIFNLQSDSGTWMGQVTDIYLHNNFQIKNTSTRSPLGPLHFSFTFSQMPTVSICKTLSCLTSFPQAPRQNPFSPSAETFPCVFHLPSYWVQCEAMLPMFWSLLLSAG